MITKVVNVNLHQPIYERLTAKQGDIASRYLLFHLLDGDKPFDLSNRTVRVYAIKPDKTEIFNDLTINDARKGYCTLELTSQCLASAGVVKMELYISEYGKVLTSIPFELEVIPCINTANGAASTNEFSALEVALSSLQDYDNLRREIVQARKGHETVGKRLDNFDSQLNTIAIAFDTKYPRIGAEATDNARLKRAISDAPNGTILKFSNKSYEFSAEMITINKPLTLQGNKKPVLIGTSLINGTVLKNVGFSLESDNINIFDLGLESPLIDNTIQGNTVSIKNISIERCFAMASKHAYLFESYGGLVSSITVSDCDSYGGVHGFISKATNVIFEKCRAFNHTGFGFACVADNIPGASLVANNIGNRIISCYAYQCTTGFNCYSRDMFSSNNANGVLLRDLIVSNCYMYDCIYYGYAIGDYDPSVAGKTYNPVYSVTFDNCKELTRSGGKSLLVGRCVASLVNGMAFNRDLEYHTELFPDILIVNSLNNGFTYPQRVIDITETQGDVVFNTTDSNPIIRLSSSSYQEVGTFSPSCSKIDTITVVLTGDNVVVESKTYISVTKKYSTANSWIVFRKIGSVWTEVYGYSA